LDRGHFAHFAKHSPHTFEVVLHWCEVRQATLDGSINIGLQMDNPRCWDFVAFGASPTRIAHEVRDDVFNILGIGPDSE